MICQPSHLYKIETRLIKLARGKKYQKGLRAIDEYLKQYEVTDEILLEQAFLLYHHAALLMYGDTHTSRQKIVIKKNFSRAINICRLIMRKRRDINDRNLLNARVYLAQIYAMLKKNKGVKKLSEETYKKRPSAFTAERVADVHMRLNDFHGAIRWYKKAVNRGKNYTEKLIAQIGLAVCYKEINEAKRAITEARTALKFLKKADRDKNAMLLEKSLYSHFPKLRN